MNAIISLNPAKTYSIVGFSIPVVLCYARRDGMPMTEKDIQDIRRIGIIGNMRETYKSVTFATAEEAQAAIDIWNTENSK
jgi:Ca2+/H+ antiporter